MLFKSESNWFIWLEICDNYGIGNLLFLSTCWSFKKRKRKKMSVVTCKVMFALTIAFKIFLREFKQIQI